MGHRHHPDLSLADLAAVATRRDGAALALLASQRGFDGLMARCARATPEGLAALVAGGPDPDDDDWTLPKAPKKKRASRRWRSSLIPRLRTSVAAPQAAVASKDSDCGCAKVATCGCEGQGETLAANQPPGSPSTFPDQPPTLTGVLGPMVLSPHFAVNNPKIFVVEDDSTSSDPTAHLEYGTFDRIVDDYEALGAGGMRQPEQIMILIHQFLQGASIPCPGYLPEVKKSDIEAYFDLKVTTSKALRDNGYLEQLVLYLHDHDIEMKILNTFLTTGGGEDAGDEYWYDASTETTYADPLEVKWSDDHIGRYVKDDFGEFRFFNRGGGDWDIETMDPTNGYKRVYYRILARCVAKQLDHLRRRLLGLRLESSGRVLLGEYLLGIEIGNELEVRHTKTDKSEITVGDWTAWGDVWFECATAMRDEADWLPLWLPGISSYGVSGECNAQQKTWVGKITFFNNLLSQILTRLGGSSYHETYAITDLVAGVDYHYYHRSPNDAQRMAYLVADLRELRTGLSNAFLQDASLTVCESGVNVTCADASADPTNFDLYDTRCEYHNPYSSPTLPFDDVAWTAPSSSTPSIRPELWTCRGVVPVHHHPTDKLPDGNPNVGALDFQAMSVWIRLAVALVGGADLVGWHTHISDAGGGFAGMGLRRDLHDTRKDPSYSNERVSWYAYQRMVHTLGTVTETSLLWPDLTSARTHDNLSTEIDSGWSIANDIWVIEFDLSAPAKMHWAYLLFIDPFVAPAKDDCSERPAQTGPTPCAAVRLSSLATTTDTRLTVYQVPTAPKSCALDVHGSSGGFPSDVWEDDVPELLWHDLEPSGGWNATFPLALGVSPTLVMSSRRLQLGFVTVGSTP